MRALWRASLVGVALCAAAATVMAGIQIPGGGYRTSSSTGATGTAGMGGAKGDQHGHLNDSTGNHWLMIWNASTGAYTLVHGNNVVGTIEFSGEGPPPPYQFTVRNTGGGFFSSGSFTPIP